MQLKPIWKSKQCPSYKLLYLQEASQLAVSVVDVLVAIFVAEGVNAVAQSQKGAVDVGSFFQPLTSILSLNNTEIDECENLWTQNIFSMLCACEATQLKAYR